MAFDVKNVAGPCDGCGKARIMGTTRQRYSTIVSYRDRKRTEEK
jgi:hypothetical protein